MKGGLLDLATRLAPVVPRTRAAANAAEPTDVLQARSAGLRPLRAGGDAAVPQSRHRGEQLVGWKEPAVTERRTFTLFFLLGLAGFALAAHAKHETHPTTESVRG